MDHMNKTIDRLRRRNKIKHAQINLFCQSNIVVCKMQFIFSLTNLLCLVCFEAASLGERLSALFTLVVPFFRVDCLVSYHGLALRHSTVAGPTLKPAELEVSIQMAIEIAFDTAHMFPALMA